MIFAIVDFPLCSKKQILKENLNNKKREGAEAAEPQTKQTATGDIIASASGASPAFPPTGVKRALVISGRTVLPQAEVYGSPSERRVRAHSLLIYKRSHEKRVFFF